VRSVIQTGAREIAGISGTYIGSNPHLQGALVHQKADTVVGFALTLFGGILGLVTCFISLSVPYALCTLLGLFIGWVLITCTAFAVANYMKKAIHLKANAISYAHHVGAYLRNGKIDADQLVKDAKRCGLSSLIDESAPPHDNIAKILRFADANPGADHVLELKNKKP